MTVTLEQYPILLWDGMIGKEAYPRSELAAKSDVYTDLNILD